MESTKVTVEVEVPHAHEAGRQAHFLTARRHSPMAPSSSSSGVAFPLDASGGRATTPAGKAVWAAAARGLRTPEGDHLAVAIEGEPDWRWAYDRHATRLAELQSAAAPSQCVASCEAGLAALHDGFDFRRDGAPPGLKVSEAMGRFVQPRFKTGTVRGGVTAVRRAGVTAGVTAVRGSGEGADETEGGGRAAGGVEVVVEGGARLAGEDLVKRAREWADAGVMEPDVVDALRALDANASAWAGADLEDLVFVLLGGTSELCPLAPLLARGATVACVARGPARLRAAAEMAARSPGGVLLLPITAAADASASSPEDLDATLRTAGADLIADAPEIRTWLAGIEPTKRLVVGSYAYLDGEAHVRASLAMDAIAADLVKTRPGTALAYLASPGTAFPIPRAAYEASDERYRRDRWTWWHAPLSAMSGGFKPNCRPPITRAQRGAAACHVHNGHLILQGPNYALAKTLQNWRAVAARAAGATVSANMAPASRTASMRHVRAVAAGLEGQRHFPPLRAFDAATSASLMGALLMYDIGCEGSSARPGWKGDAGDDGAKGGEAEVHPMDVFGATAVHGGTWRCAYTVDSIGKASYILGTLFG